MMGNKNRDLRENLEASIVQELQMKGLNATPATRVFGPKGFRGLSEEQTTQKVKAEGYTAVMIVSIVDREKEQVYNQGVMYSRPVVVGYSRYYRRYIYVYDQVYSPGYYTTSSKYLLQAEIYSVTSNELIYSGQTQSYDPNSIATLSDEFSKTIVKDLINKGLITP